LRVLHLAPPPNEPNQITAHSFIDEEIAALRAAGVECLTLPRIETATVGDRTATLAFAAAQWARVPAAGLRTPREMFHAVRLETTAARVIRDCKVDVVHSHFGWPAGFGGTLAASATGVPLVASLRGMDLLTAPEIGYGLRRDPLYAAAVARLLTTATRTLYATDFMRERGIAAGAPSSRATLVRKGVDLNRFRPPADRAAVRGALGITTPMILAVGTLSKRKNLSLVLDALTRLTDSAWSFVIVGDGAERDALDARAASLGIRDRVRFAGSVARADIGRYFAAADVFVHAAVMEAAGNVILEALAVGCPIVCTDAGGPTEYVCDGDTGFVVPPGDTPALASRVGQLLASPALRCEMAHNARASAEREFDYGRMIRDVIQIYVDVSSARIP